MTCILNKKDYEAELNELEQIVGSPLGAYRLLTENNGYTLDKDPWGNPSILYQQLLEKYNGDRNRAIFEKSKYYTSKYYKKHGNWTMDSSTEPVLLTKLKTKPIYLRYSDIIEQRSQYVIQLLSNKLSSGKDYTKLLISYFKHQAEMMFNNLKQRELLSSTNQALIKAFDLQERKHEDGTIYYTSKNMTDGKYDLIVEFSNRLYDGEDEVDGWYDYNAKSQIAHHIIKLAIEDHDPSTFDHELAHHYIRMFWNSPLVQDALSAVYKDGMTMEETEEALVDILTDRRRSLLNNTSDLFTYKFWNEFYEMLQRSFNKLTGDLKEIILNNMLNAFEINQNQEACLNTIKYTMHEGRMFKKSKYSEKRKQARETTRKKKFQVLDSSNKVLSVLDTIVNKALRRRNILENKGFSSPILIVLLNRQEQRARLFIDDINEERKRYELELKDSGEWESTGFFSKDRNSKKISSNKKEKELSFDIIYETLRDALQDMLEYIEMLDNAETYGFVKTVFINDESIEDAVSRKYIRNGEQTGAESEEILDEDTLHTVGKETVAYYSKIVSDINLLLKSQYARDYFTQELIDSLSGTVTELIELQDTLTGKYKTGREKKIQQFIKNMIFVKDENGKYMVNPILNMEPDEAYAFYDEAIRWIKLSGMDTGWAEKFIGVKEFSKSPIVRMLHYLIFSEMQKQNRECEADANRLRKLKRDAKKEWIKGGSIFKTLRTFDKMFLETCDGEYDGNLLDRINRGKYLKNKDKWFDDVLYGNGFTYTKTDGTKIKYNKNLELMCKDALNDLNFELNLDEKGEPMIPDHLEDILKAWEYAREEFYCENTEREFVKEYYKKRVEILSPMALKAHRTVSEEINRILKLCMVDGKPHTELLTVTQMAALKDAYKKQGLLSSHYDISGREKKEGTPEYKIMLEFIEWRKIYPQITYERDEDAYNEAKSLATDEAQFKRQNSYMQIASFVWDVFKDLLNKDDYSERAHNSVVMGRIVTLKELRALRSELTSTIKEPGIVRPYWELIFDYETGHVREEAEEFLYNLKKIDLAIAELTQEFEDPNANYEKIENPVLKSSDRMTVNEAGRKVEVYDDMCKRIIKAWKESGDPDWKDKAAKEKALISYIKNKGEGPIGLSIFRFQKPTSSTLKNPKTGKYENTVEEVPIRIFSKLSKEKTLLKENDMSDEGLEVHPVYNKFYDRESDETIQPNSKYINEDYAKLSSDEFKKSHPATWKYYEELKSLMKDSFESLPFTGSYNSLAPQIGARWKSYCARVFFHPTKWASAIKYSLKRYIGLTEDDQDVLIESWEKRNDGSISKKIPIRYIKRLDDANQINTNLLYTVSAFRQMSEQYKWRKKLNGISLLIYENAYDKNQGNHVDVLENMIDTNLYGVDMTGLPTLDTNVMWRTMYKIAKFSGLMKNMARMGLLAGNVSSGLVAAGDSACSVIQDVVQGKYANDSDFRNSIGHLAASLPQAIASFGSTKTDYFNYTNTITLMNFFGITESAARRFTDADQSRIRKLSGISKTLMMPFLFADYNTKAMYTEEVLNNIRYIPRFDKFMSEDEAMLAFINDGLDYREARSEYSRAQTMRQSLSTDKYGNIIPSETESGHRLKAMSEKSRDDLYTKISGKILSRSAYYNGMILDSEKTPAQSNPWMSWITMLRNFMIIMAAHKFSANDDFYLYRSAGDPPENILDYLDDDNDFGKSIFDESSKMLTKGGKAIPAKVYAERTQHHRKGAYNFLRGDKYVPEIRGFVNAIFRQYDEDLDKAVYKRFCNNGWNLLKYWWLDTMTSKPLSKRGIQPFRDDLYLSKTEKQKEFRKQNLISYEEISAINTVMCAMLLISATSVMSIVFHNTFVDDYDDELWFNLIDLILLRIPMEKASGFSISTIFELVKSITAGQSPIENFALSSLLYDCMFWSKDSEINKIITGNGSFLGKRKYEKDLLNTFAVLGLKNMHKQVSVPAVKATKKFYKDLDLYTFPFFVKANPSMLWKDNKKGLLYDKNQGNGNMDIYNIDTNFDTGSFNTDLNVSNLDVNF